MELKALPARTTLAASVGWKASQKRYLLRSSQGCCSGKQVICPLFLPTPQHPLSITSNPKNQKNNDEEEEQQQQKKKKKEEEKEKEGHRRRRRWRGGP